LERRKGSLGLRRSAKGALAAWTPTPSARWALSRELSGPLEADHWAARALLAHDLPWGTAGLLLVRVTSLLATAFAPALPSARVAAATPSSFLLLAGATARSAVRGAKRGQAAPARGGASRGAGDEGGPSCDTIPIGEPKLLEGQHVVGAREVTEDSGVGDVVRGVGEALIDAAEEVEHELAAGMLPFPAAGMLPFAAAGMLLLAPRASVPAMDRGGVVAAPRWNAWSRRAAGMQHGCRVWLRRAGAHGADQSGEVEGSGKRGLIGISNWSLDTM